MTLGRRIFAWFVAVIVLTASAVGVVSLIWVAATDPDATWIKEKSHAKRFVGVHMASLWDTPHLRDELVHQMASESGFYAQLDDPQGQLIIKDGPPCTSRPWNIEVKRSGGPLLGRLTLCSNRPPPDSKGWMLALAVVLGGIWIASWLVARSLARPLGELADVARRMGQGELEARASKAQSAWPEIASVANAMHEMADRLDRQMRDQRTLLAAVSHELRTPLGHLRLLVELGREGGAPKLDEVEREVLEMDDLVDQLLATSRLDFALHEARALDVVELGLEALERAGLGPELLEVRGVEDDVSEGALKVSGDPTLLRRALANLLRNAREHGGGVSSLVIEPGDDVLTIVVVDSGPGLDPTARERLFEPFVQLPTGAAHTRGALGLGLYLVRRVATAHSGDVVAEARPGGGARVGVVLRRLRV